MGNKLNIYRVTFKTPPEEGNEQTDFFFTSLAAIYDRFTAEQVGAKVESLWNVKITESKPYRGRRCQITKETVERKAQKSPAKRSSPPE